MVLAETKIYFWKRIKYSLGYREPTNSHEDITPNLCGEKKFLETMNKNYKHLFEKILEPRYKDDPCHIAVYIL